jgi:hypothetical protein
VFYDAPFTIEAWLRELKDNRRSRYLSKIAKKHPDDARTGHLQSFFSSSFSYRGKLARKISVPWVYEIARTFFGFQKIWKKMKLIFEVLQGYLI